jgi:hypothetical protein
MIKKIDYVAHLTLLYYIPASRAESSSTLTPFHCWMPSSDEGIPSSYNFFSFYDLWWISSSTVNCIFSLSLSLLCVCVSLSRSIPPLINLTTWLFLAAVKLIIPGKENTKETTRTIWNFRSSCAFLDGSFASLFCVRPIFLIWFRFEKRKKSSAAGCVFECEMNSEPVCYLSFDLAA